MIVYETLKAIVAVEDESLGKRGKRVKRGRNVIEDTIARHGSILRFFDTFRGVKTSKRRCGSKPLI